MRRARDEEQQALREAVAGLHRQVHGGRGFTREPAVLGLSGG